jgi:hypothetical protein
MAVTKTKSPKWNVSTAQVGGLLLILAIFVVAVATDSLVIGYVGMTLILCAFFLVVAFDVSVAKHDREAARPVRQREAAQREDGGVV